MPTGQLTGKTAVITGGSRGLGAAIARAYAAEGAAVVVAARSQAGIEAALRTLEAQGAACAGLAVDVARLADVEALADRAIKTFGRIDIWVNNAGTAGPYGPTLDFTPEMFHQVIGTNIAGVYHGSRTALRHMTRRGSGKLINVLGHGYRGPVTWQNAYSASKAWVRSFTQCLAEETRASGVGVYAFNPGMVLTELLTDVEVFRGSEPRLKNFPTVVRLLAKPPEAPARKAVWLASAATDGRTGLLVSASSGITILEIALRELGRILLRRPAAAVDLHITSIAPDPGPAAASK
jgi:glucose 1-dehydrogenase